MRNVSFKFRIYPTASQAVGIRKACGCRRFVYNWGLEQKQRAFQRGERSPSAIDLANMLPGLKKTNPWLKTDANSQSLQTALRDLDVAFTRFFKKAGGYPRFKSKHKSKDSFQVPQYFKVNPKDKSLTLPKLGNVRTVFDRVPEGKPKSITVSMSRSGKFFASVLCEQDIIDPDPKPVDPATTIGIDVGIKTFVVCSDGRRFENPKNLRKAMSKLKFLSRQHSRKKKGGKNRERARRSLAKRHEKVANRRIDFLHKTSDALADENQVGTICVEDLNVKGMLGNHKLAGVISDCAWGEFFRQLEYKCKWRGIRLVRIGRFDPSSRLCPCGFRNDRLTLSDRTWTCPKCRRVHDRDVLASNNIKMFGLAKLASLEEKTAAGTVVAKLGELSRRKGKPRTKKLSRL